MTGVLAREALEAVAIVVVTTAALGAGRADERSRFASGTYRRVASPLALSLALGVVAVVAAVAVVAVFGGAHRDVVPASAVVPAERVRDAPSPPYGVSLRARLESLRVHRTPVRLRRPA